MKAEVVRFSCGRYGVKRLNRAGYYVDIENPSYSWEVGDRFFPYCKTRFKFRAEYVLKKYLARYTL